MAKRKLQMLSNHVFEELAMDAYDEVDRRETDAIWNGLHSKVSDVIMHELAMPKVPFINFIFFPTIFLSAMCQFTGHQTLLSRKDETSFDKTGLASKLEL